MGEKWPSPVWLSGARANEATIRVGPLELTASMTASRKLCTSPSHAWTQRVAAPWQRAMAANSSMVTPSRSSSSLFLQQFCTSCSSANQRQPLFHRSFGSMESELRTMARVVMPHEGGELCVMNCSASGK